MATPTTATPSKVKKSHPRGSGHDLNSDTERLTDEQNMQDKTVEDSFPASDPASNSPVSGVGATRNAWSEDSQNDAQNPAGTPKDFKDNKAAQFEYGRRTEAKTFNYEQNTNRFRKGNPDVGNVDLGNIEADKPAQPDDNDHND